MSYEYNVCFTISEHKQIKGIVCGIISILPGVDKVLLRTSVWRNISSDQSS